MWQINQKKKGNYADYRCKYIFLPKKEDMADGNGDKIWLVKWNFDYGWFVSCRPQIEVLTLLGYIFQYYC